MMTSAAKLNPAKPSLREAKKAFTRTQICEAAKQVFAEHGLHAATMDQIAQLAGTPRTTLYSYFQDKEQIFDAVAREYLDALKQVYARLPGPQPTTKQINAWMHQLQDFVSEHRTSTLLTAYSRIPTSSPGIVDGFKDELVEAMAAQLPAFANALELGRERDRAWAKTVVRELGWGLCYFAEDGGSKQSREMLTVAAELLQMFLQRSG